MNAQVETRQGTATGGGELALIAGGLQEIDKVAAGLAELRLRFKGLVYDVRTADGMDAARKARQELRKPRYEVERIRKAAKAPILELGRKLDREADRITKEILAIEAPIDSQIDAEEQRIEAEKRLKAEIETRRVNTITADIRRLADLPINNAKAGADALRSLVNQVEHWNTAEYQEFQRQGDEAKARVLEQLRGMLEAREAADAEAKRLVAERAEIERQQAEQTARLAEERRKADEANRAERERIAAEQRRADEEARAAREKLDAERRAFEQQQASEREAVAARQAELDRQTAELACQREEAEAAKNSTPQSDVEATPVAAVEAAAGQAVEHVADAVPEPAEIIAVLADCFAARQETVLAWLRAIDWQQTQLEI